MAASYNLYAGWIFANLCNIFQAYKSMYVVSLLDYTTFSVLKQSLFDKGQKWKYANIN